MEEDKENILQWSLKHCRREDKHKCTSYEEFKKSGGEICPLCLLETVKELALSSLAIAIQLEHGLQPKTKRLRLLLDALVPERIQTRMEKAVQEQNLKDQIPSENVHLEK